MIERKIESYLGGSASVQNRGAKLRSWCPGERCQGTPAMGCREEAGSLDLAGWPRPMSRYDGRVCAPATKPNLPLPEGSACTTKANSASGGTVRHAVMLGKRLVYLNDEIPRRPRVRVSVILHYKAQPKSEVHASMAGTASAWPRLQGCQQCQSTTWVQSQARKALPQIDPVPCAGPWDKLVLGLRNGPHNQSSHLGQPRRGGRLSGSAREGSPFFGARSVPHGNTALTRDVGVARCVKHARR